MTDIDLAREKLREDGITFAAAKDGEVIASEERGIKPILDLYTEGFDMTGYHCADKVVGKAPAMLYVLLGVSEVYAHVMTKTARDILVNAGIGLSFETLTDVILRRDGKDLCPMEKAVKDIDDPEDAAAAVRLALAELAHNN